MNGQELLSRMKRLGEVDSVKQVTQLTTAMFPGPHCPLMGAMMAVRGIRDGVMLVVGTDECTYYTKNTTWYTYFTSEASKVWSGEMKVPVGGAGPA